MDQDFSISELAPQRVSETDTDGGELTATSEDLEQLPVSRRQNHFWLTTALNSAADAIVIVSGTGQVVFLNPAAERLTGWVHRQARGEHFTKVLVFEHAGVALTDDLLRLATLNEEALSLGPELALITRNGRWRQIEAEISASGSTMGHSTSAVFTLRDITLRKWEEHQSRQEHAIRAVERLAESTTHALNNQLTTILGNGELLLHTGGLTEEQREIAGAIHNGAQNVAEVVRQLSSISRAKFVTRRELDLNDVIRQVVSAVSGSLPDYIRLRTELNPELGHVNADCGQLEQILYSLVNNAQESFISDQPGEIVISTEFSVVDAAERLRSARNFISVKVRDNGVGMSRETCERIFEPFFTTKKAAGHMGLGLCMTQGIIRDYQGFIDVKSSPDKGTEITFGIPGLQEDAFAYLDGPADGESAGKTVLVVEDDHAIRHLLRKILEKHGYKVIEARDGEDALVIAELDEGRIDVLVTDIAMPGMSGPDLVRHFTGVHPEAKYLLISGFSADRMGPALELPRGVDFLQKPFRQGELLIRIENLLSQVK